MAAPLLCLQRLDGMPAKRTTKDEWVDVMTNILNARKARVEDKKSAYKAAKKPLLTIDNAAWYKIKYEDLGFDMEKLPLPARSPDIHKFVEHAVANLENTMTEWERDHPNVTDPEELWAQLERLFYATSGESVAADIRGMRHTLAAIIEAKGNWPAAKYRCTSLQPQPVN